MNFNQIKLKDRYAIAINHRKLPKEVPEDAVGIVITAKSQRIFGDGASGSKREVEGWFFKQNGERIEGSEMRGLSDDFLIGNWKKTQAEAAHEAEKKRAREESEQRRDAVMASVSAHLERLGWKEGGDFNFSPWSGAITIGIGRSPAETIATMERFAAMLDRLAEEPGEPPPFNDSGPFDND